jgi:hypothetical protein
VAAALLMALAAVLAFRMPAVRVGTLLGAGLLAGVAWSAVTTVQGTITKLRELEAPVSVVFDVEQGDGVTMLIVAAGVAVVSAVLHQELPRRVPSAAIATEDGVVIHQIEGDDSETPPYGFPVLVEPQEPQELREPHETTELKEPKSD